jgi:hypothetical protein
VNTTRWVLQLATANRWHGPVLRLRRWCTLTKQVKPSASFEVRHREGMSARNSPPSAAKYGMTMNARDASGRSVWQVGTQRDPLADDSQFYVDSGLQRRPRLKTRPARLPTPSLDARTSSPRAHRNGPAILSPQAVRPPPASPPLRQAAHAIEYATDTASPCHWARYVAPAVFALGKMICIPTQPSGMVATWFGGGRLVAAEPI